VLINRERDYIKDGAVKQALNLLRKKIISWHEYLFAFYLDFWFKRKYYNNEERNWRRHIDVR
jgi:hypothetical protein